MGLRLPPAYVNVEMGAVLARVSDGALREYCRIRAVSWGKEVVEFSFREYAEVFGEENVSESTFYRRLSELRTNGVLRYSSSRNAITGDRFFRVAFTVPVPRIENGLLQPTQTDRAGAPRPGNDRVEGSRGGGAEGEIPNFEKRESENREQACLRVVRAVTGWVTLPGSANLGQATEVVDGLLAANNGDERAAADYLRGFLKAWKDKGYRATNMGWLTDWAAVGEIPGSSGQAKGSKLQAAIAARRRNSGE